MTTLNNKIRNEIIESVISRGTTINARKDAIKLATERRVRELCVERVPQDFINATKNMPAEWFPHQGSVCIDRMLNPIMLSKMSDEDLRKLWRSSKVNFDPIKSPVSARFGRRDYRTHAHGSERADDPESWEAKLGDLIEEAKKIRHDEETARLELSRFLQSVKTYKQAVEKMPEIEPHLPDYAKPMPLVVSVAPLLVTLGKLGFK